MSVDDKDRWEPVVADLIAFCEKVGEIKVHDTDTETDLLEKTRDSIVRLLGQNKRLQDQMTEMAETIRSLRKQYDYEKWKSKGQDEATMLFHETLHNENKGRKN